jgi:hypothetical protein
MSKIISYFEAKDKMPSFTFFIEKAVAKDEPESSEWIIEGVASTTSVDHDRERMAMSALKGMANIINEKTVPLNVEHLPGEKNIVGEVFQASVDDRGRLTVKAKLDKSNPTAKMLYDGLKAGAKLGLSVGGAVKRATRELAEGLGKYVKTFYDVILDHVAVTPKPSNYEAWLFNKSIISRGEDISQYYNTPMYDRFLFENPHLDYLYVIEKSIPSKEWIKVDNNTTNEMKKNIFIKDVVTEDDVKTSDSVDKEGEPSDETTGGTVTEVKVDELGQTAKDRTSSEETMITEKARGLLVEEKNNVENVRIMNIRPGDYYVRDNKVYKVTRTGSDLKGKLYFIEGPDVYEEFSSDEYVTVLRRENAAKSQRSMFKQSSEDTTETTKEGATDSESLDEPIASKSYVDAMFKSFRNDVISLLKSIRKDLVDMTSSEKLEALGTTDTDRETGVKSRVNKEGEPADETMGGEVTETKTEEVVQTAKDATSEDTKDESVDKDTDETVEDTEKETDDEDVTKETDDEDATKEADDDSDETEKTNTYGEDYQMDTLKHAVRNAIKKGLNPLDVLTAYVSDYVNQMNDRFAKTGKRILGLEQMVADMIRNDEYIQKSIKKWMNTPGLKKSVSLGSPYMVTKEGRRYRLIAEEEGVEKSVSDAKKDFKTIYKEKFSSVARGEILG